MTRGRKSVRAFDTAGPVAEKRGQVQYYERGPGMISDFTIMSPGLVSHVQLRCVRRLCCSPSEIERDRSRDVATLRLIASSREISREIWLCSPRYALRFFRVLDTSIIELGRDGLPLPSGDPGPAVAERAVTGAEGKNLQAGSVAPGSGSNEPAQAARRDNGKTGIPPLKSPGKPEDTGSAIDTTNPGK